VCVACVVFMYVCVGVGVRAGTKVQMFNFEL